MKNLPEGLEKFLATLGVNTTWLRWRFLDLSRWWERQKSRFKKVEGKKKYKYCRCGKLYLADDKVCDFCGRKLPPYTLYRISRFFAIDKPVMGFVSTSFIFLIIILYVFQVALYGASSLMIPSGEALVRFGALSGRLFQHGDYWRIFSMALVHIGVIHILFNAIAISQMLPYFEDEIGPWASLALLTFTQIFAAAAHLVFYDPMIVTAGASGIGFGLIGFGAAYFHRLRRRAESKFFLQWFVYGMIFGIFFHANNAAHVGGFIAGLPLGFILAGRRPGPLMRKIWKLAGILCLVLWIASLVLLVSRGRAG